MNWRALLPLLLTLLFTSPLQSGDRTPPVDEINDAAAFLAGLPLPHRSDHPLASTSVWQTHARQLNQEFESHHDRVLLPMGNWARAEIPPPLVKGHIVRYLFSGPDILHALHMFPDASTFIMCGLEPVGRVPDLNQLNHSNTSRALWEVRNALGEIVNFSFFRTKDMKKDLRYATFHGTTPIMMIFLARSGQHVKSIEFLELNEDGTLTAQGGTPDGANAVKITFAPQGAKETQTLYYFSTDLSDGGFSKNGFQTWLELQPQGNAYLKAASFLMHQNWFTGVRQHLLDYSFQIVEDDSGIPFRHFEPETWQAHLYGQYNGPIDLFSQYYQSDMRAAYRKSTKDLPFGTGYKWRKGQSNLMRFVRIDEPIKIKGPSATTVAKSDSQGEAPEASTSEALKPEPGAE